jgi:hypothetical protein
MTVARRRQIARLESLAEPYIERIRLENAKREQEIAARIYDDALIQAANLSLIILFGNPRIDEPLSGAWERCCKSTSSELCDNISKENRLNTFGPPFDRHGAQLSALYFRKVVMPRLPGADVQEKFDPIFAGAPLWLLWFTWGDATIEALHLKPRDRSEICKYPGSKEDFFRWPALHRGSPLSIQPRLQL